jgi:hypothetical protein
MVGLAVCIAWVLYRLVDPAARPKPLTSHGISQAFAVEKQDIGACEPKPKPV